MIENHFEEEKLLRYFIQSSVEFCPEDGTGTSISAGRRISFDGLLYRSNQAGICRRIFVACRTASFVEVDLTEYPASESDEGRSALIVRSLRSGSKFTNTIHPNAQISVSLSTSEIAEDQQHSRLSLSPRAYPAIEAGSGLMTEPCGAGRAQAGEPGSSM